MNNLNIHHTDIPYEIAECEDKIVVLKVPVDIDDRKYKAIKAIINHIKETCGANEVIIIPDDINFNIIDKDKAIGMINGYIDELHHIKEELLKNEVD